MTKQCITAVLTVSSVLTELSCLLTIRKLLSWCHRLPTTELPSCDGALFTVDLNKREKKVYLTAREKLREKCPLCLPCRCFFYQAALQSLVVFAALAYRRTT